MQTEGGHKTSALESNTPFLFYNAQKKTKQGVVTLGYYAALLLYNRTNFLL